MLRGPALAALSCAVRSCYHVTQVCERVQGLAAPRVAMAQAMPRQPLSDHLHKRHLHPLGRHGGIGDRSARYGGGL